MRVFVVILGAAILGSCAYSSDSSSEAKPEDSCLSVLSYHAPGDNGRFRDQVTGEAVNNCGVTIGSAFLEFNLYDSTGTQIGTTIDSTQNLEPGVKWAFKASLAGNEPHRIKLAKVTALR